MAWKASPSAAKTQDGPEKFAGDAHVWSLEEVVALLDQWLVIESPTVRIAKSSPAALIWISIGCIIALFTLLRIIFLLREFYFSCAAYAPETEIRPILEVTVLAFLSGVSIVLGGICVLSGLVPSIINKRWKLALIGFGVGILTWIPLFVGYWGIHYVMSARKLIWAD